MPACFVRFPCNDSVHGAQDGCAALRRKFIASITRRSLERDEGIVYAARECRSHIDGEVWHLDVGSSHPGAVVGPKGWAVRPLKRYAIWVQNVVRQFGPYPPWA